jgi:hypothetical protein
MLRCACLWHQAVVDGQFRLMLMGSGELFVALVQMEMLFVRDANGELAE